MTSITPILSERARIEGEAIVRKQHGRGYAFTYHIRDEHDRILIADIECDVEMDARLEGGEPVFDINAIWLDGIDILGSNSPHVKMLAAQIATAAEDDEDLQRQAMDDAGISYRGQGGNDPDGHFIRRAW